MPTNDSIYKEKDNPEKTLTKNRYTLISLSQTSFIPPPKKETVKRTKILTSLLSLL